MIANVEVYMALDMTVSEFIRQVIREVTKHSGMAPSFTREASPLHGVSAVWLLGPCQHDSIRQYHLAIEQDLTWVDGGEVFAWIGFAANSANASLIYFNDLTRWDQAALDHFIGIFVAQIRQAVSGRLQLKTKLFEKFPADRPSAAQPA